MNSFVISHNLVLSQKQRACCHGEEILNIEDCEGDANMDNYGKKCNCGVLIDVFRYFHKDEKNAFTCWNTKTRARETNYGTRIDYILASENLLLNELIACSIRPDILGSDHCPVETELKTDFVQSSSLPELCAINMPELCGKQQGIKAYFTAGCKKTKRFLDDDGTNGGVNKKRKKAEDKSNLLNFFSKTKVSQPKKSEEDDKKKMLDFSSENNMLNEIIERSYSYAESKSINNKWKSIFKGPPPNPLCSGHKESTVLRTVKKEGPNIGRQFFVCNRPAGHANNKEARCDYFLWKTKT